MGKKITPLEMLSAYKEAYNQVMLEHMSVLSKEDDVHGQLETMRKLVKLLDGLKFEEL